MALGRPEMAIWTREELGERWEGCAVKNDAFEGSRMGTYGENMHSM